MKPLIYMVLCLMCSCSTKRKLTSTTRMDTEKLNETRRIQTEKQSTQSLQFSLDSSHRSNWLKIYPRDVFTINKDGFVGSADSLIWYGNNRQFSTRTQKYKQDQEQSHSEVAKSKEQSSMWERKSNVLKAGISLWWMVGCGVLVALFFVYCRRFLNY